VIIEPLKSKIDRHETLLKDVNEAFKVLKAERAVNLQKIHSCESLLKGRLPSLKWVLEVAEKCSDFTEVSSLMFILKEMRFLGSPKRHEISSVLVKKMADIYASQKDDEALLDVLREALRFDQMNPLVIPQDCPSDACDAFKTIFYTAHDLLARH
jgi:hypothetical protein